MIAVWGFANCSTVKKACEWLQENQIEFSLINTKKQAPSKEILEAWAKQIGLEKLLNKKSTSWRLLSPEQKIQATSLDACLLLMQKTTGLIKRPIITSDERGKQVLAFGFDNKLYSDLVHEKKFLPKLENSIKTNNMP